MKDRFSQQTCQELSTVGLSSIRSNDILIYPNPATSHLFIELKANREWINYEILNEIGQIVIQGSMVEITLVETHDWRPGMYVVKFRSTKALEFRKIMIK